MENQFIPLGIILIVIGFLILLIGTLSSSKGNVKVGIGGFIGPIPFGFANDPKILLFVIILSLILLIFFFLQFYR